MPNEPWGATYADCVNSAARLVPSPAMLTPAVPISWADAVAANAAMATTGATRRNRELRIFLIELEFTVTHVVRVERNRETRRGIGSQPGDRGHTGESPRGNRCLAPPDQGE